MTAPERRRDAASLRLAATCWVAQAVSFETGFAYLTDDPAAERIALHLRECAREAVHAARRLEAEQDATAGGELTPCDGDCPDEVREIGRTDDDRPAARMVVITGGAA